MTNWLALALIALLFQSSEAETKIVEYLKENVQPGQPVVVSNLYNNVFTTPQERQALDRLFNTFFKIPMFIVQYHANANRVPTLQELSEQFHFTVPGQADVMLRILEADPRVPNFIERDPRTGEIRSVDIERILADPRFGRDLERSIAGWEGSLAPPFAVETFPGQTVTSQDFAGQPHLVYFWFTNCPPCVRTAPMLVELYDKYASQGFKIAAVNADRFLELPYEDSVRSEWVQRLGVQFTAAHMSSEVQDAYGGVSVFPTMFFVDRQGVVLKHFVNFQEKEVLEGAIQDVLRSR